MSSFNTVLTLPVPVANVIPAAAYATPMAGLTLQAQTPYSLKCKSGMSLTTYPVTVEVTAAGADGAAVITVYAHNFGMGPLQTGACRDKAMALVLAMQNILASWAQQAAAARPQAPQGS